VIVMVAAHVTDAWTRMEDRSRDLYGYTVFIAGFAAPLFLFLAGLTLTLAASARAEAIGHAAAASQARWRALQIFALAFVFRLQSQLFGWGPWINFFKVDILNVMGLAMLAAAVIWSLSANRTLRVALFSLATGVVAMSTPLVREAGIVAALPDLLEAYIRPLPGLTTFAIFPWAAFLLGGTIAGELIVAAKDAREERRLQLGLAVAGAFGFAAAYWLSFRPSIYPVSNFWTSSPTFFFLRLGVLISMIPAAWLWNLWRGWSPLRDFGVASLFVYWIHVEMVYGVVSAPLHRRLTFAQAIGAFAAFALFLFLLVKLKDRFTSKRHHVGHLRDHRPIQQIP
jgi:uncharacterized membrane protein